MQEHGVDVEEVGREDPGRLGGEELLPGRGCPPGRGREPGDGQDAADRSRADPVPEAEERALDAPVSPARVRPGQPPDQLMDLLRDWRPSGGVRVGPLVLNQAPVPASRVPVVTIRCSRRCLGSSRAKAAITARSAQSGFGWATLTAQDRYLVPQHQDLHLFGRVATDKQYQPGEQTGHSEVDEADEHECRG